MPLFSFDREERNARSFKRNQRAESRRSEGQGATSSDGHPRAHFRVLLR